MNGLLERELERIEREHPRSAELGRRARKSLLAGVPMHWMVRWPGAYPVFARDALGARFTDVDGNEYVDFCLGCAGAGGYTREHGLEPDLLTVGKAIGSGIPSAAYGFSEEAAARVEESIERDESDVGGVGGTLAASVLSLAAVRATLEHVLTDEAFARMIALGERFEQGVHGAINASGLPWHVTRIGARVEYLFRPERPRTGSEAAAGGDRLLDRLIHLYMLNRGVLMTPFHNMALMSPATTEADVDHHTAVFDEAARELAT